jgi:DNA mismatch repair protein MutL
MITIVNGRPIESRTLNFAILESYHTYIPKGKYPVAFLFLEVDPAAVDVNVHPAKREVRFRDEGIIRQLVIGALLDTLQEEVEKTQVKASVPIQVGPVISKTASVPPVIEIPRPAITPRSVPVITPTPVTLDEKKEAPAPATKTPTPLVSPPKIAIEEPSFEWSFIGKLKNNRSLFETASGLVILNNRAAHQRIRYESIIDTFSKGEIKSQALLLPVPLELDALSSAALLEWSEFLNKHGFKVEEFGRNFFRIEALPTWLAPDHAEVFVRDLAGLAREGRISQKDINLAYHMLSNLACKYSITVRENLTAAENSEMAKRLLQCKNPLTCPKGKLTYFEIADSDIDRRLKVQRS